MLPSLISPLPHPYSGHPSTHYLLASPLPPQTSSPCFTHLRHICSFSPRLSILSSPFVLLAPSFISFCRPLFPFIDLPGGVAKRQQPSECCKGKIEGQLCQPCKIGNFVKGGAPLLCGSVAPYYFEFTMSAPEML